ncbi:MAG: hypothetical protein LLG04_18265 [Parachlamydia sp.]|nr:hypothetical protein [Parachlamydia sp.]
MLFDITNIIIGTKLIHCEKQEKTLLREIQKRVLVLALPIFNAIETAYFLAHSFKATVHDKSACLSLARSHFASIFTSVPVGLIRPVRALKWEEQKINLPERALSFEVLPHSRLGDNLACYTAAKWVAFKTKLPLILHTFPLSNELTLNQNCRFKIPKNHPFIMSCKPFSYEEFAKNPDASVVWQVPFMANFDAKIDWSNEEFRAELLKDLAMIDPKVLPPLVPNRVNVALHVRTGGNFDPANSTYYFPTKIPPRAFFEEGLKLALKEYGDKPVHIQIYTDSVDPEKEVEHYRQFARKLHPNATLSTAANSKKIDDQITSDMIAMSRYECLIRADSGLSKQSSQIGKPCLEIMPRSYQIDGNTITLEGFQIVHREKQQDKVVKESREAISLPIAYTYAFSEEEGPHFYAHHRKLIGEKRVLTKATQVKSSAQ